MRSLIVTLSLALFAPSVAAASDEDARFTKVTLSVFGTLGLLGSLSIDGELAVSSPEVALLNEATLDYDLDLAASHGGGLQLDVPLQRYFSAAATVRVSGWRAQTDDERSVLLDLLFAPRLRIPIAFGKDKLAIPFVQVPVGLSHLFGSDGGEDDPGSSSDQAFAIGVGLGTIIMLSESFGLSLELGWLRRSHSTSYSQTIVMNGVGVDLEVDADTTISEAYLQPGLTVAF